MAIQVSSRSTTLILSKKKHSHPPQTSQNTVENFHIFNWPHETQPWNINVDVPDLTIHLLYQGEKFQFTVLYNKMYSLPLFCHCFLWASELLHFVCLSSGRGCPVVILLSCSLVFSPPAQRQCTEKKRAKTFSTERVKETVGYRWNFQHTKHSPDKALLTLCTFELFRN